MSSGISPSPHGGDAPCHRVRMTIIKPGETRQGSDTEKRQKMMFEITRKDVPGRGSCTLTGQLLITPGQSFQTIRVNAAS